MTAGEYPRLALAVCTSLGWRRDGEIVGFAGARVRVRALNDGSLWLFPSADLVPLTPAAREVLRARR